MSPSELAGGGLPSPRWLFCFIRLNADQWEKTSRLNSENPANEITITEKSFVRWEGKLVSAIQSVTQTGNGNRQRSKSVGIHLPDLQSREQRAISRSRKARSGSRKPRLTHKTKTCCVTSGGRAQKFSFCFPYAFSSFVKRGGLRGRVFPFRFLISFSF